MSEASLQQLLQRLDSDETFRTRLKDDPETVFAELDALSPAEHAALASNDEDALRRLVCADVTGLGASRWGTLLCGIKSEIICWTAGSQRGCGTGDNCGTAGSRRNCGTGGYCVVR